MRRAAGGAAPPPPDGDAYAIGSRLDAVLVALGSVSSSTPSWYFAADFASSTVDASVKLRLA